MAVLTSEQLTELRQEMARGESSITWDKPTINAACQAVEDLIEGSKSAISSAIDVATSPAVLPNPIKLKLVKFYFHQKFNRGG